MRRTLIAAMLFALALTVTGAGAAVALEPIPQDKITAGYLYVGPVADHGWTYMHHQGEVATQEAHPGMKTLMAESVPENADVARTMKLFIRNGANVIFSTSYGYMDYVMELAAEHPEIYFMQCDAFKKAPNVGSYYGRMYEAYYLAGITAGKMTKTNTLGFVAAVPIPDIIGEINAFILGARKVNPEATVKVIWLFSWYDPAKEKEAGKALLDAGADVINIHVDSAAIAKMAEEEGIYVIGCNSDMSKFAPTRQLTSQVWDWSILYNEVIDRIVAGTWTNEEVLMGLKEGVVSLAPFCDDVPQDVRDLVSAEAERIKSGECTVFDGPLVRQDGKLMVEEGRSMTYPEIHSITWFVEGVEGSIPQ